MSRRTLLTAAVALIGLAMLIGLAVIVMPEGTFPYELLGTIAMAGGYALGGTVALSVGPRMRRTRAACLLAAGLSFVGYTLVIWCDTYWSWAITDAIMRAATGLLIVALALMQRLALVPLRPAAFVGRVAQRAGLIGGAVLAGMLLVVLVFGDPPRWLDEMLYVRFMGAVGVFAAGGTLASGVVRLIEGKPDNDESGVLGAGVPVRLGCPRCGSPVDARANRETRCGACRLRVRVEVEEPRCQCGYLLYRLPGDTCPECGRAIPPEDRWSPPAGADPVAL